MNTPLNVVYGYLKFSHYKHGTVIAYSKHIPPTNPPHTQQLSLTHTRSPIPGHTHPAKQSSLTHILHPLYTQQNPNHTKPIPIIYTWCTCQTHCTDTVNTFFFMYSNRGKRYRYAVMSLLYTQTPGYLDLQSFQAVAVTVRPWLCHPAVR